MAELLALIGVLAIAIAAGRRNGKALAVITKTAELRDAIDDEESEIGLTLHT